MKECQVCGMSAREDEHTCANCGEQSWRESSVQQPKHAAHSSKQKRHGAKVDE